MRRPTRDEVLWLLREFIEELDDDEHAIDFFWVIVIVWSMLIVAAAMVS